MWHVKQKEKYGKLFFLWGRIFIYLLIILYWLLRPFTIFFLWIMSGSIFGWIIGLGVDLYLVIRFFLPSAMMLSYYFSPAEIGARRYANKHFHDSEWRDVIKIEQLSKEEMLRSILDAMIPSGIIILDE